MRISDWSSDVCSSGLNRRVGNVASSANGLLSKLEPLEVTDHALPGRISGRCVLLVRFGEGDEGLAIAIAHLSLGRQSRLAQLSFIAELLSAHPHAVLIDRPSPRLNSRPYFASRMPSSASKKQN